MSSSASWHPGQNSNLFYQSRLRRPLLDRAEGIYLWDVHGKRYIDGSSGAMVSNIGHSNPRVLDAMRRQMERATFATGCISRTSRRSGWPRNSRIWRPRATTRCSSSPADRKRWRAASSSRVSTPSRSAKARAGG